MKTDKHQFVAQAVADLMAEIGIKWDDDNRDTPERVARMYLDEVMRGLTEPCPKVTTFPNPKGYDELICVGPISLRSMCSHHLVPVIGKCWIGMIPGDKFIGLSKFNRLAQWVFAKPCMQEHATKELVHLLEEKVEPRGLGVVVKAQHFCLQWRGVKDSGYMATSAVRGILREDGTARQEFFQFVGNNDV